MVVEKLTSALLFGAVRGTAQIVQKLEAARPLSAMAMDKVMRRIGESVTVHGFRSSFRDWAGNETHFPRELAEAALAHVVGDKAEQAYRRSYALEAPGADGGVGAVVVSLERRPTTSRRCGGKASSGRKVRG